MNDDEGFGNDSMLNKRMSARQLSIALRMKKRSERTGLDIDEHGDFE